VNGARVDASAPQLVVAERGFLLGDGLFETMRVRGGVIFRRAAHLARLADGAERMGIVLPSALSATLEEACHAVREAEGDVAFRLTVTRGTARGVMPPSGVAPATVVLTAQPAPVVAESVYQTGLRAHVVSGRRNEHAMTVGIKTLAYADSILALREARAHGADEALMLDTAGHLSEASSSNVFVVKGGVVSTPPVSCGALPGITRAVVRALLAADRIEVHETQVAHEALGVADEVFCTSALRGVAPVAAIGGRSLGAPGEVTRAVMAAYAARVRADCGR